jgi:hypothetical protein
MRNNRFNPHNAQEDYIIPTYQGQGYATMSQPNTYTPLPIDEFMKAAESMQLDYDKAMEQQDLANVATAFQPGLRTKENVNRLNEWVKPEMEEISKMLMDPTGDRREAQRRTKALMFRLAKDKDYQQMERDRKMIDPATKQHKLIEQQGYDTVYQDYYKDGKFTQLSPDEDPETAYGFESRHDWFGPQGHEKYYAGLKADSFSDMTDGSLKWDEGLGKYTYLTKKNEWKQLTDKELDYKIGGLSYLDIMANPSAQQHAREYYKENHGGKTATGEAMAKFYENQYKVDLINKYTGKFKEKATSTKHNSEAPVQDKGGSGGSGKSKEEDPIFNTKTGTTYAVDPVLGQYPEIKTVGDLENAITTAGVDYKNMSTTVPKQLQAEFAEATGLEIGEDAFTVDISGGALRIKPLEESIDMSKLSAEEKVKAENYYVNTVLPKSVELSAKFSNFSNLIGLKDRLYEKHGIKQDARLEGKSNEEVNKEFEGNIQTQLEGYINKELAEYKKNRAEGKIKQTSHNGMQRTLGPLSPKEEEDLIKKKEEQIRSKLVKDVKFLPGEILPEVAEQYIVDEVSKATEDYLKTHTLPLVMQNKPHLLPTFIMGVIAEATPLKHMLSTSMSSQELMLEAVKGSPDPGGDIKSLTVIAKNAQEHARNKEIEVRNSLFEKAKKEDPAALKKVEEDLNALREKDYLPGIVFSMKGTGATDNTKAYDAIRDLTIHAISSNTTTNLVDGSNNLAYSLTNEPIDDKEIRDIFARFLTTPEGRNKELTGRLDRENKIVFDISLPTKAKKSGGTVEYTDFETIEVRGVDATKAMHELGYQDMLLMKESININEKLNNNLGNFAKLESTEGVDFKVRRRIFDEGSHKKNTVEADVNGVKLNFPSEYDLSKFKVNLEYLRTDKPIPKETEPIGNLIKFAEEHYNQASGSQKTELGRIIAQAKSGDTTALNRAVNHMRSVTNSSREQLAKQWGIMPNQLNQLLEGK